MLRHWTNCTIIMRIQLNEYKKNNRAWPHHSLKESCFGSRLFEMVMLKENYEEAFVKITSYLNEACKTYRNLNYDCLEYLLYEAIERNYKQKGINKNNSKMALFYDKSQDKNLHNMNTGEEAAGEAFNQAKDELKNVVDDNGKKVGTKGFVKHLLNFLLSAKQYPVLYKLGQYFNSNPNNISRLEQNIYKTLYDTNKHFNFEKIAYMNEKKRNTIAHSAVYTDTEFMSSNIIPHRKFA